MAVLIFVLVHGVACHPAQTLNSTEYRFRHIQRRHASLNCNTFSYDHLHRWFVFTNRVITIDGNGLLWRLHHLWCLPWWCHRAFRYVWLLKFVWLMSFLCCCPEAICTNSLSTSVPCFLSWFAFSTFSHRCVISFSLVNHEIPENSFIHNCRKPIELYLQCVARPWVGNKILAIPICARPDDNIHVATCFLKPMLNRVIWKATWFAVNSDDLSFSQCPDPIVVNLNS